MGIKYDKVAFLAWFTPVSGGWGLPVLWTGSPGLAKTAKNKAWAKHFLSPFLHLSPGQKGDGYFGVVPVPYTNKHNRDVLKFPINDDIDRLIEVGHGLILVDELRSAPGIVRPALLGLFQERMFGDATTPVGVRVWAASNATKEAVNGRPLSAPEANRACHIRWPSPTAEEMMQYGVASSAESAFADRIEPDYSGYRMEFGKIEAAVLADRQAQRGRAMAEIFGGFVARYDGAKGDILHKQPEPNSPMSDGPWPSPRSWTNVADVLATYRTLRHLGMISCKEHERDDLELGELIRGCVGPIGGELMEWLREQDIPDYGLWLDGKLIGDAAPKFERGRDDRTLVIMTGSATHILALPKGSPERKRRVAAFWKHALHLSPISGLETVLSGAKLILKNATETGDLSDLSSPDGQKFTADYRALTARIASGGDGD